MTGTAGLEPAPRYRRRGARLSGLVVLTLLAWSLWESGLGRQPTANVPGWEPVGHFVRAVLAPDLSAEFLAGLGTATLTTLAFAFLGTTLAVAIGMIGGILSSETWWRPYALLAGRRVRRRGVGWYVGRIGLSVPRGIHEAVWALILVTILGRDPMVGILALALPFGAITAKVYADLIDAATGGAHAALVASGCGRFVALLYGVLPIVLPDLVSYAFYRLECAIRSAVILGMIGAGGLGFHLSLSFLGSEYGQMWTIIMVLVALSAIIEGWGAGLRSAPTIRRLRGSAVAAGALLVLSCLHLAPNAGRLFSAETGRRLMDLARSSLPPRLPSGARDFLVDCFVTLQMSVIAIATATALALLVVAVVARGRATGSWAVVVRFALLMVRAVSLPVWALLLLFMLLPGVLPGAVALGIYNFGVLGRLFVEVLENLDEGPAEALRGSGASALAVLAYATAPRAAPRFAAYALYRWETAIRDTAVVGVVGAQGLGRVLEEGRAAFDYPAMLSAVVALVGISLVVDVVSASARRALR